MSFKAENSSLRWMSFSEMVNGCEGTESSNAATAKTPEPSGRPQQKGSYLYCEKERLSGDQFEELKAFIDIVPLNSLSSSLMMPGMIRKVVREWVSDMLLIDGKSTLIQALINVSVYLLQQRFYVRRSSTNFRFPGSPFAIRFIEQTMYVQIAESVEPLPTERFRFHSFEQLMSGQSSSKIRNYSFLNPIKVVFTLMLASEKSIEKKVIAEQDAFKKGLQAFHWKDYWQYIPVHVLCLEEIIHLAKRKKKGKGRSYGYDNDVTRTLAFHCPSTYTESKCRVYKETT
ncbi:unnamed protein product [Brassica oleracea]|uniref:Uncharacterized protein n=1 Tax=Brassica oleracea TaxID=3712 RepID=A0A3P6BDD3_BRAOL|nr:unnamed protein product [Brassica oleracea]